MATGLDLAGLIQAAQLGRSLNPEVMQQQALGNQLAQQLQQLQIAKLIRDEQDFNNPQARNMRALQDRLAGKVDDPLSGIEFTDGGLGDVSPTLTADIAALDQLDPNVRPAATVANQVELLLGSGGQPTGFQFNANKQKQGYQRARSLEEIINPTKPTIVTSGPFAGMAIDANTLQARDILTAGGATLPEISRKDQERLLAIERDQTLSAEDRAFARQQELERIRQSGAAELERQKQTGRETLSDIAARKATVPKPLPRMISERISDAQSSIDNLITLKSYLDDPGVIANSGPIQGRNPIFGGANPFSASVGNFEGIRGMAKQNIGKYMEGGVLRLEDEKKYEKIIPGLKSLPAVQQNQSKELYKSLKAKLVNDLNAYERSGYDVTELREGIAQLDAAFANAGGKSGANAVGTNQTVEMTAPDGSKVQVHPLKVEEAKRRGLK